MGGFQADFLQFISKVFFILADFVQGFIYGGELLEEDCGQLRIEFDVIETQFPGGLDIAGLVHEEGLYGRFVENGGSFYSVVVVILERLRLFYEHVLCQIVSPVDGDALDLTVHGCQLNGMGSSESGYGLNAGVIAGRIFLLQHHRDRLVQPFFTTLIERVQVLALEHGPGLDAFGLDLDGDGRVFGMGQDQISVLVVQVVVVVKVG